MIKEWLPHLIVSLLALAAGAFGTSLLSSNDSEWQDKQKSLLGGFSHQDGNSTLEAHLPPRPMIAWATFLFTGIGAFYLAAAVSGWINRTEF